MKLSNVSPTKFIVLLFVLFLSFSCSKDSDLLSDYILADGSNALDGFVVDDVFMMNGQDPIVMDVLTNDGYANQDKVEIVGTSIPRNGSVVVNEDKTLTYIPGPPTGTPPATTAPADNTPPPADNTPPPPPPADNTPPPPPPADNTPPPPPPADNTPPPADNTPPPADNTEEVDSFTYTTEVTEEDGSVTTETANVSVDDQVATETQSNSTDVFSSELKAFPAAYGAGSFVTGGRGGQVIHVTNLNDSGVGSFRRALSTQGSRTIVFDVSGTIKLERNLTTPYGNFTIAGQTAPIGGVTIVGMFELSNLNNIIIRYIKVRPEFLFGNDNADCIQIWGCSNVIIDHVSVSWGGDEALEAGATSTPTYNITFQNNLIAESKNGAIMGSSANPSLSYNFSALGNLWWCTDHRHPNTPTTGRADVINNVVWGYGYRLNRFAPGAPDLNEINNYFVSDVQRPVYEMNKSDYNSLHGPPQIFSKGNLHLPTTVINADLVNNNDTWTSFGFTYNGTSYPDDTALPVAFFTATPHALLGDAWPIMTAQESVIYVKTDVGANKRLDGSGNVIREVDTIDTYYIANINSGIAPTVPYPFTMSGKSHYTNFHNSVSSTPINSHPTGYDSDNDGMPDVWEIAKGFDPNNMDQNNDSDGDGYTNLEEFINLVDF